MKRITFIVVAMLMSLASFAQAKGEKYVAGTFRGDFGTQKTTYQYDSYSNTSSEPTNTSLVVGLEYGHFVVNNLRLSVGVGVSYLGVPIEETNIRWLRNKTVSYVVNPNVSYYVPVTDKLYYAPEIGASFESGSIKDELTLHKSYTTPATGWSIYAHFFALEYRVSPKVALGMAIGSFSYGSASFTMDDSWGGSIHYKVNQAKFNFNNSNIVFRYYL